MAANKLLSTKYAHTIKYKYINAFTHVFVLNGSCCNFLWFAWNIELERSTRKVQILLELLPVHIV